MRLFQKTLALVMVACLTTESAHAYVGLRMADFSPHSEFQNLRAAPPFGLQALEPPLDGAFTTNEKAIEVRQQAGRAWTHAKWGFENRREWLSSAGATLLSSLFSRAAFGQKKSQ